MRPIFLILSLMLPTACPAHDTYAAPTTRPSTTQPAIPIPPLSPLVTRLLNDPATDAVDKRRTALFHGQWNLLDKPTAAESAAIALERGDYDNPAFDLPETPRLLTARARLERGDPEKAIDMLGDDKSPRAALLRARALDDLGKAEETTATLSALLDHIRKEPPDNAPDLAAAAEALAMLARYNGLPADNYKFLMSLLGKARSEYDPLYWPAPLVEARLLFEKDNPNQGVAAAFDVIALNPRSSDAWYLLGQLTAMSYNFDVANRALAELRSINPDHPLAGLLQTRISLAQRDSPSAMAALKPVLARHPRHREAAALLAAVEALSYDETRYNDALQRFDTLAPGNPLALLTAGKCLSAAKQYTSSETALRRAVALRPHWAEPRVELGLLLMQIGDEDKAFAELREAVSLDPFNNRASNQLKLVEELRGQFATIQTEHFIIRYKPGIDEVLALDMPETLERFHREVTGVYQHKPARITRIEIMPDEQWFGVRITGLPEIWTIGAATGDVIAITPPRQGAKQRGTFDWPRVIRHEFTHTVTLDQTLNRIPHWFTEACAVSQEPGGRDYNTARMLADALSADELFPLDEINWAFIRPKTPRDRPLAYAQANWMLEYITATAGHRAIVQMLGLYRAGTPDGKAITAATGKSPADFFASFKAWAKGQVTRWGLAPKADAPDLRKLLDDPAAPEEKVRAMIEKFPNEPDLLQRSAAFALAGDPENARQAVLRYAAARPVDPWSDRMLVQLATRTGRMQEAIGSLEQLDRMEQETGAWAQQLATIFQASRQFPQAMAAAQRAIDREPYNPSFRELAATIALQSGNLTGAFHHLRAMTLIEPDRAANHTRLAAVLFKLERKDDARSAALKAKKLDPSAPVDAFLK